MLKTLFHSTLKEPLWIPDQPELIISQRLTPDQPELIISQRLTPHQSDVHPSDSHASDSMRSSGALLMSDTGIVSFPEE